MSLREDPQGREETLARAIRIALAEREEEYGIKSLNSKKKGSGYSFGQMVAMMLDGSKYEITITEKKPPREDH